jgi:hypothetical protein
MIEPLGTSVVASEAKTPGPVAGLDKDMVVAPAVSGSIRAVSNNTFFI